MRVAFRRRGQKIKQQEKKKKMRENSDRQVRIPPSLSFQKGVRMRQRPDQQLSNNEVADVFVSFSKDVCVFFVIPISSL